MDVISDRWLAGYRDLKGISSCSIMPENRDGVGRPVQHWVLIQSGQKLTSNVLYMFLNSTLKSLLNNCV